MPENSEISRIRIAASKQRSTEQQPKATTEGRYTAGAASRHAPQTGGDRSQEWKSVAHITWKGWTQGKRTEKEKKDPQIIRWKGEQNVKLKFKIQNN